MLWVIAYDIPDNSARTQIADFLIAKGMQRVQKSVFKGNLKAADLKEIRLKFSETVKGGENLMNLYRQCKTCASKEREFQISELIEGQTIDANQTSDEDQATQEGHTAISDKHSTDVGLENSENEAGDDSQSKKGSGDRLIEEQGLEPQSGLIPDNANDDVTNKHSEKRDSNLTDNTGQMEETAHGNKKSQSEGQTLPSTAKLKVLKKLAECVETAITVTPEVLPELLIDREFSPSSTVLFQPKTKRYNRSAKTHKVVLDLEDKKVVLI